MNRIFVWVFLAATAVWALNGDTLEYSSEVTNLANGDTFWVDKHWAPLKDSIQQVVNGRLGDVNLADDADIKQSKIDSTADDANDWINTYTKDWQVMSGNKRQLRSDRGIAILLNDSTGNSDSLHIIADSTDTIAAFYEDSVRFYEPVRGDTITALRMRGTHVSAMEDTLVRATMQYVGGSNYAVIQTPNAAGAMSSRVYVNGETDDHEVGVGTAPLAGSALRVAGKSSFTDTITTTTGYKGRSITFTNTSMVLDSTDTNSTGDTLIIKASGKYFAIPQR